LRDRYSSWIGSDESTIMDEIAPEIPDRVVEIEPPLSPTVERTSSNKLREAKVMSARVAQDSHTPGANNGTEKCLIETKNSASNAARRQSGTESENLIASVTQGTSVQAPSRSYSSSLFDDYAASQVTDAEAKANFRTSIEQAQSILLEEIIVKNCAQIANDVPGCRLIIAISNSGLTASLLAKARPSPMILLLTDDPATQRRFLQVRGVRPLLITGCGTLSEQLVSAYDKTSDLATYSIDYVRQQQSETIDRFEKEGLKFAKESGLVNLRDKVFVMRSMPYGYDQIMKIVEVGEEN